MKYFKICIKQQTSEFGQAKRLRAIRAEFSYNQKLGYGKTFKTRAQAEKHLKTLFKGFDLITQLQINEYIGEAS